MRDLSNKILQIQFIKSLSFFVLDVCTPYSLTACFKASSKLGLQLGGNGKKFIGNHAIKGCHAEGNISYYGIEKTERDKHRTNLDKPFYRPIGYDCGSTTIKILSY